MGLLRNLAKKVVGAAKAVKDEAAHPGRPPSHKVDTNPFHRDDPPAAAPAAAAPAAAAAPSHAAEDLAAGETASGKVGVKANQDRTGRPWYLDGTQEGWDATDPT